MLYCWLLAAITQVHRVYWAKFCVRFDAVVVSWYRCFYVMIDEHRSMIDSPCSLDSPFTRGGALSHVCTLVRTRARTCVLRVYMGERERVCIYNYFFA
jgi:hypothetical protein